MSDDASRRAWHLGGLLAAGDLSPRGRRYYDPGVNPAPRKSPARMKTVFDRGGEQYRSGRHQSRAQLCAAAGVTNTGRQWVKLRKTLRTRRIEDVRRG